MMEGCFFWLDFLAWRRVGVVLLEVNSTEMAAV